MTVFWKKKRTLAAALVLGLSACAPTDRFVQLTGYAQGGTYAVKFNMGGVAVPAETLRAGVDSILTLVDTTLSGYNRGSMLSRFNAGEPVRPNALFIDIYAFARAFYEASGGAVDVAAGPLFDAWGFGFTRDSLPDTAAVARLRAASGMGRLRASIPEALRPDGTLTGADLLLAPGPAPQLNYNAVAQGYTADLVADYLRCAGVRDLLVDIGEIACDGHNPSGRPWAVGIDRPVDGNDTPGADLTAVWESDGGPTGIVTSGNYRKFYVRDSRKYAHTVDPRTGYPVADSLLSATVVAPDAATADAAATWCMVLGLEDARTLVASRPDLEACLIYASGDRMRTWRSSGFRLR